MAMPAITLEEINKVISQINVCKGYDSPDMLEAKTNWLEILTDARDRYSLLTEDEHMQVHIVCVYHYMNYSQMMVAYEMAGATKSIANLLIAITNKKLEKKDADSGDSQSTPPLDTSKPN